MKAVLFILVHSCVSNLIPGAAQLQAPLYQRRSRRKDEKRKTQATATSEFLSGGGQTVEPGVRSDLFRYPIFSTVRLRCDCFYHVLFQIDPVSLAAACAPISGQQHWRGRTNGRDQSDRSPLVKETEQGDWRKASACFYFVTSYCSNLSYIECSFE